MNCPYCDMTSLTTDGLEQIAICKKCRGDWMTGRGPRPNAEGNVIYLPFAWREDRYDKEEKKAA